MKFVWLLALVALGVALVACGPASTVPAGNQLPPHIISVSPADGSVVSKQELLSEGIKANFNFRVGDGLGRYPANLIRFYINDNDVSIKLHWTITKDDPPSSGSFLYEPSKSISSGWKTLKIIYWDMVDNVPNNRYDYSWRIKVQD
jgi:hypothetical protein